MFLSGYQAQTTQADGSVFVIGGSWSGGRGDKTAEVGFWSQLGFVHDKIMFLRICLCLFQLWTKHTGWEIKADILMEGSILTDDEKGVYRSDNHMWLHPSPDGRILQAGPSKMMHWIDTAGDGSVVEAGLRGDHGHAMCGSAVHYDVGKLVAFGGAANYVGGLAHQKVFTINMNGGGDPVVTRESNLIYPRSYVNGVVLPNGEVLIVGMCCENASFQASQRRIFLTKLLSVSQRRFYVTQSYLRR
jgi:galactose oxidase